MAKAKQKKAPIMQKPRCGACGSGQTYHRKKDNKQVCVTCGNSW